ncbi:MAG: serine/threonine protein kinase [Polyangiales bacterium]
MVNDSEQISDDTEPLVIDGAYRVQKVIGYGGMGVVLLAHDDRLKRDVAIKVIEKALLGRAGARDRFIAEAQAMARVQHENVVQIFALGDHDGLPYFAMEYVPGTNLADCMAERDDSDASIDIVLGIIEQVGRGLDAIHRTGAVHADVKPGNVLIGHSHRIVLADFGLARKLGEADDTGLSVGTPSYLPPEFLSNEVTIDGRADVYSLGVMTYEMITGRLPYKIETISEYRAVHREATPALPPSYYRPDLSRGFDKAILQAISRDPEERQGTGGELAYELMSAREELRVSTPGYRIVIADDDEGFRRLAQATLEYAFPGSETVLVRDGEAALKELDLVRSDLAVIDLDMPGLNGIELTAAIRAKSEHGNLRILVVTAAGGATDWRLLQSLGADGFLVKPLQPLSLVATARRILRE